MSVPRQREYATVGLNWVAAPAPTGSHDTTAADVARVMATSSNRRSNLQSQSHQRSAAVDSGPPSQNQSATSISPPSHECETEPSGIARTRDRIRVAYGPGSIPSP